jgi:hypothetical protein
MDVTTWKQAGILPGLNLDKIIPHSFPTVNACDGQSSFGNWQNQIHTTTGSRVHLTRRPLAVAVKGPVYQTLNSHDAMDRSGPQVCAANILHLLLNLQIDGKPPNIVVHWALPDQKSRNPCTSGMHP